MFNRNPQPGEGFHQPQQQAQMPSDSPSLMRLAHKLDLAADFVPVGADFSLAPDPEDRDE